MELFRDSDTSLEEWARSRKELDVADFEVAVDESGNVVASGESKEEALRKAQENVEE
ncbi:hypothetical protein HY249_00470 [Candidatus Azambacteria bacterium]|nr:hypothetical protein [Candidatus Azambacteria bacterium]